MYFYPRPPRGGRLCHRPELCFVFALFLSTPSARRATPAGRLQRVLHRHFYPRPPRGGRLEDVIGVDGGRCISIHALREEGDGACYQSFLLCWYFYPRPPRGGRRASRQGSNSFWVFLSTPSARRATVEERLHRDGIGISIHALREEGDPKALSGRKRRRHFYPRPPRGGRLLRGYSGKTIFEFLSTPSARRAT